VLHKTYTIIGDLALSQTSVFSYIIASLAMIILMVEFLSCLLSNF